MSGAFVTKLKLKIERGGVQRKRVAFYGKLVDNKVSREQIKE